MSPANWQKPSGLWKKVTSGVMPSRWQHWSFPTLVLLTRSPTSNYPQTRHHYENPELGGWSWSTPLDHREGGGPHQKERGAAALWLCLPSSRQQEGPSGPVVYPVGKKESPKWTSSSPSTTRHFLGGPTGLAWRESGGICRGSTTEHQIET